MNELLKTLNEYLQAAAKLAIEQAPHVWDNTLLLVRLQAIYELIMFAVIWIILANTLLQAKRKLDCKTGDRYCAESKCLNRIKCWDTESWWIVQFGISVGAFIISGAVFLFGAAFNIFLGIFSPGLLVMFNLAKTAGIL